MPDETRWRTAVLRLMPQEPDPAPPDLNQVVRDVLAEIMRERGWSENRAAKALGLRQRSFSRFMKAQHGLTLRSFATLCAELGVSPIEFLQRHPTYALQGPAEKFARTLEEAQQLGVLLAAQSAIEAIVVAAKAALSKGIQ